MSASRLVMIFGVSTLAIAGCNSAESSEVSTESTAGVAGAGSDLAAEAGSTEVEGPEPRLVIADADSGRIEVIDLATEESVGSFDVENAARLTMVNGRYVVAVDSEGGRVDFLDPGSWTIEHGDHSHSYVKDPAEIGSLDGEDPAHVLVGDRKVAVFYDGTGTADVVDFDILSKGEATVATTVEAVAPHHGIVIPVSGQYIVSSGGGEGDLPNALELRNEAGELVRALDGACPDMHGTAVFPRYFVLACDDGVLKVEDDFTTTKLPYPTVGNRAWSFDHQGKGAIVSAATAEGVLALDTRSGRWVEAKTADKALASSVSADGKTIFSLQTDGTFRTFDGVTGAELSSTPVLSARYDEGDPMPSVEVGGNRAYISDPEAGTVIEIDYRDAGRISRIIDLGFSPASVGVVGA
ncbi:MULTISPECIES: hypothetical protein [unclassified Rhodococcus (in: high G+C Gram-positive bacteria)]|uniref:hypothetical protein n=1 Tax=unclassified Rhodococcus (in: high G+C Gram-positive bacteria) TaxID=192944 RepID=UPI00339278CB